MKDVNEQYEIIRACGDFPWDDFALGRDRKTGKLVVIYSYDMGYGYPSWSLEDLLDIDTDKLYAAWMDNIAKMITSTRPYSDKFADIFKGDNK